MQRGKGNKIKTSYASPVKQAFGLDSKTDLFNPTLYQKGLRAQYFSPKTGKVMTPNQMDTEFDRRQSGGDLMADLKSKDSFLGVKKEKGGVLGETIIKKDKKKKSTNNTKTSGGSGGINPELLLAMTMPFSYAIGKGLSALFGRRKSKTQEIAEDGEKQQNYSKTKQ